MNTDSKQYYIELTIADDEMSASLRGFKTDTTSDTQNTSIIEDLEKPRDESHKKSYSSLPSFDDIATLVKDRAIVVGCSHKRIKLFLQTLQNSDGEVSQTIAKGLKPKHGKDSRVKPLVPNALDRVLAPQESDDNKVDMRDLGDIFSVQAGQAVSRRVPPTNGRAGKTVLGDTIDADSGSWVAFALGDNTEVSPKDENIIVASVAGQPKFENGIMSVIDTFVTEGVNVATGNVTYTGAVIVNGDVTENMEINATGDVTINGFVDCASIRSGGDIVITQGASGKTRIDDCRLVAKGSVYVQHAQGLDVSTGKNLNVAKQLAYSRVKCKGMVIVGDPAKPMGNLFATSIQCENSVQAGSIGAISGSSLTIDFGEGFDELCLTLSTLQNFLSTVSKNSKAHETRLSDIHERDIPEDLKAKLLALIDEIDAQRSLMQWIEQAIAKLEQKKNQYSQHLSVVANKELFPGVTIKLGEQIWRTDNELQASQLLFIEQKWEFSSL